jgi:polysaccharide biosynthesis transport protein
VPDHTSLEKLSSRTPEVPPTITVPAYTVQQQEQSEGLPLLEYWRVLRKRQWTVLSIVLLVVVTVMIGTFKQTPVYRARGVLQIDREGQNILSFKEVIQLDPTSDDYLETAYRVLQSRTLARRVIDKLKLEQVPEFQAQPSWFSRSKGTKDVIPQDASIDPKYQGLIRNFLSRLTVSPIRRSRLVEISFDSVDPALASRVVNTLAYEYIDQNLEVKYEATLKASEWLRGQLSDLKQKLEKSEADLNRYARENSILFVDDKQQISTQKLKQLEEELTKAEADRIQKEALYSQVRNDATAAAPGLLENRIYQEQSLKLSDLKREYAEKSAQFTPEWPQVKRLKAQIDEIERTVARERSAVSRRVADEYQASLQRVRLLREAVGRQTSDFNNISEKSIQYSILKRDVDSNRSMYEGLLQRLKEAGVSAGLKASNIRLVDAAERPMAPARPRKALNLALALLSGLGLGVGLAFFQEYLDNTLKTPDDVQRYLRLATLGVIPAATSANRRLAYGYGYGSRKQLKASETTVVPAAEKTHPELIGAENNPNLAEAYRSLRTSVLLSTSGRPPRVLLVTSGQPGEGKSTTVVNLAVTLCQLGGKVLVIDTDMRRPRVGSLLQLKANTAGLSTYLTGQSTLDEAVVATRIPNLYAVPCGPIPPNPAELVSSEPMRRLIREAAEKFDYVILDSPPVLHVSDARILATQVEAVVLVAHGGSTPREVVNHARSHLQQVSANIIGVVLNNVDFGQVGYDYYYRYYRSYGYGYGYGYGEDDKKSQKRASA